MAELDSAWRSALRLRLPAELAIRGVRSYDPKSIHIIQFFKPLTVIVGHNGSGKTVGGVGGGAG